MQHQQAFFRSLTYYGLYSNFFLFFSAGSFPYQHVWNHCKQRLGGFWDPGQVAFRPHAASPPGTFHVIWKSEWCVSPRSEEERGGARRSEEELALAYRSQPGSWSLHAERDPRWHQGNGSAFVKTSRDWVTSLGRLINRLRPTVEMWWI